MFELMHSWPVAFEEVLAARERLRPHLTVTPLRRYKLLDEAIGQGLSVWVKHENHQPIGAFKVRNALAAMTMLRDDERRGVLAASRGNHGQGLAWAGERLGIPVTVCVPRGNNPEKNAAMRALGAEVVEEGADYDESLEVARRIGEERGLVTLHSTNDQRIIAGAGTIALEILEEEPALDAMVIAVGGGSQAVGALTVARALAPELAVYGVQAERASAIHDGWHAGHPLSRDSADTFADGVATRDCYALTFDALRQGLRGFVTASEAEIASAIRLLLRTTHNLAEGAGALGLAGLVALAPELAGKRVAVILSGGNIDEATLRRVVNREL
jgi:threonine dehydratase